MSRAVLIGLLVGTVTGIAAGAAQWHVHTQATRYVSTFPAYCPIPGLVIPMPGGNLSVQPYQRCDQTKDELKV